MTRFKVLAGLAAAFALAGASGAATAQTLVSPPSPRQIAPSQALVDEQAQDVSVWLAEVATWGQTYNVVLERRADTLLWLMESPTGLLNLVEAGDKPGAGAWATRWAAEARGRLASEAAAFDQLPSQAPVLPSSVRLTAEQSDRLHRVTEAPAQIGAMLASTRASAETYIPLVVAAAAGEPDDLLRLSKGIMTLIAAQLEAENVMLAGARVSPDSPNHHFATAQIETNSALIIFMRHRQATMLDQASDAGRAAAGIRGHAAATRVAVSEMRRTVDAYEDLLATDPAFSATALAGVFDTVFASLRASAAVEARLANELDVLAGAVAQDDETAMEASTLRIEGLANERIALDTARRRLLAENGG